MKYKKLIKPKVYSSASIDADITDVLCRGCGYHEELDFLEKQEELFGKPCPDFGKEIFTKEDYTALSVVFSFIHLHNFWRFKMDSFKQFFLSKIFSRKMVVWIAACVMLCFKFIDQNTWLIISLGYMGINAALSAINSINTAKSSILSQNIAADQAENKEKEGEV